MSLDLSVREERERSSRDISQDLRRELEELLAGRAGCLALVFVCWDNCFLSPWISAWFVGRRKIQI